MINILYIKARSLFFSLLTLLLISTQLHAHPGHEHNTDWVYMISHSLTHSGLFIASVVIVVAAIIFTVRKIFS